MKKIIIGCFMILVNIYFYVGSSIIGLIPDFAGYILISGGIKECVEDGKVCKNVQKYAFAACIFSAAVWVMDLLAVTSTMYVSFGAEWGYVLRAVAIVFIGIVTHFLLKVFEYAGAKYNYAFDLKVLRLSWLFVVAVNVLMLVCSNFPAVYSWVALGEVLTTLWFLIMLYLAFEKAFEVSKGKRL